MMKTKVQNYNIFDFIEEEREEEKFIIDDENIQNIYCELVENFNKNKFLFPRETKRTTNFSVWEHAPHLGKRLEFFIHFDTSVCGWHNNGKTELGLGWANVAEILKVKEIAEKYYKKGIELNFGVTPESIFFFTMYNKYKSSKKKSKLLEEEE